MTFGFSLRQPSGPSRLDDDFPATDIQESFDVLVMEACSELSETDCRFEIGGFGTEDWSFSISYDLSAMMEQLPSLLENLRSGLGCEIDLYSQGIERTLNFIPVGDVVEIECISRTSWAPEPAIEYADRADMLLMIAQSMWAFSMSLQTIRSPLAHLPPFPAWRAREV